jgi:predicted ArsR family transcriptional regulator
MRRNKDRGTYNTTKTKVLLYLSLNKFNGNKAVGLRSLCEATGADYNYLKTRLKVWSNWGYLDRVIMEPRKGRPFYGYRLAVDGEGFLRHLSQSRITQAHQSIFEVGASAGSSLPYMRGPGDSLEELALRQPGAMLDRITQPGETL